MAAPAQTGQGRLRPLEPRPRPPVSHYADRPLSQGRALSARPDRPRRTRPTHCAWILHALRCAGAGTYRPRWTALPRKTLPAEFSSFPPRRRPSRGTAGQKPIGLCHPGPKRNQRTTLQDCSRQRLSRPLACTVIPLHTVRLDTTLFAPSPRHGLEASSPGLDRILSLAPCLALSLLPPR
jgi:hypothetical protein